MTLTFLSEVFAMLLTTRLSNCVMVNRNSSLKTPHPMLLYVHIVFILSALSDIIIYIEQCFVESIIWSQKTKLNVFKVPSGGRHGRRGQPALRPAAWGYRRGRDTVKIRRHLPLITAVRVMPGILKLVPTHLVS